MARGESLLIAVHDGSRTALTRRLTLKIKQTLTATGLMAVAAASARSAASAKQGQCVDR
jgi:hypothetical protein